MEVPESSYHYDILESARQTEINRAKSYSKKASEIIQLTSFERLYLRGAQYKLDRIELQTKDPVKALDDLRDAYNYVALLFREMKARFPAAYEELLKQQ